MHPAEVALLNGMQPAILSQNPIKPLRLDLAGVGQMGSPIQSAWILGNLLFQVSQTGLLDFDLHPRQILGNLCEELLNSRDALFPNIEHSRYMQIFATEISSIARPLIFKSNPLESDDEDLTQEIAQTLAQLEDEERAKGSQPPVSATPGFALGIVPGFAAVPLSPKLCPLASKMPSVESPKLKLDSGRLSVPGASMTHRSPHLYSGPKQEARSRSRSRDPLHLSNCIDTDETPWLNIFDADPMQVMPGGEPHDTKDRSPVTEVAHTEPDTADQAVYVIYDEGHGIDVTFAPGSTISHLAQAEAQLHPGTNTRVATSFLGMPLADDQPLHPDMALLLHDRLQPSPQSGLDFPTPPVLAQATRAELLWRQQGWVAVDEMDFYLHMVEAATPSTVLGAFEFPDTPDATAMFAHRILTAVATTGADVNTSEKAMAWKYRNHWFPVLIRVSQPSVEIWTTHAQVGMLQQAMTAAVQDHPYVFRSTEMPHAFAADCGFQTIGWILSMLLEEDVNVPWTQHQACQWRALFHEHLQDHQGADTYVATALSLGGAKSITDQLTELVEQHGVHPDRSQECATQLLQTIGSSAIQQVLQSPKPWADLKAKASLHQIRVVLASELQTMIHKRAKEGKPIGRKQNKIQATKGTKQHIQLRADQIMIPPAVFRQTDQVELSQLLPAQIAQGCQGVIIANIEESLPYFGLQAPLSPKGVGLLVLDFADPRLPAAHSVIKVPAICTSTSEPVILTAALVQLGSIAVERNTPEQCLAIQEIPNSVLRVLVFRDQFSGSWSELLQSPVKKILAAAPFDEIAPADVLEVWDRQYLTLRMRKDKPEHSEIFAFNVRLTDAVCSQILKQSGSNGLFFEPRSQDGREPHHGFQVVWMPRKTFSEARVAQTATPQHTTLVRNGDRYGLRVTPTDAEAVHSLHRPELQFLEGTDLKRYKMGPMPYGTSKQSIMTLCKKWGWSARPVGPQGQTLDRSGTMWAMQASSHPPAWVYQLAHGDILISAEDVAPPTLAKPQPVLASQKTMQSLKQHGPAESSEDPWAHYDPWKSGNRNNKELSVGQVTSIEANLERKLIAKLANEDAPMHPSVDARVTNLEQKMEQLSANLTTFQQGQQQQNQQVQQQLQNLDTKIDHQSQSLGAVLDHKLEDQMKRIESLLLKRRAGEWLGPRPKSKSRFRVNLWGCKLLWFVLTFLTFRIGEATNPGPGEQPCRHQIGCINPNGLMGKGHLFRHMPSEVGGTIWAVSETHLTCPGASKFAAELKFHQTGFQAQMGAPVPPKSGSVSAIGGKQRGVGFLTTTPCRAMTATWEAAQWNENRFHAATFQVGQRSIQGGVVYGHAALPDSVDTKQRTDLLCQALTTRLLHNSRGLRFIAGDFNQEDGGLTSMVEWANAGWINIQKWAFDVLGKPFCNTCHGTTIKDHIFLSPELAMYLHDVHVDDSWFSDHAVLWATFDPIGSPPLLPLWRQIKPLPWQHVSNSYQAQPAQLSGDPTQQYQQLCAQMEHDVADHLVKHGHSCPAQCLGRATTREVRFVPEYTVPPRKARQGDIQPEFHGTDLRHAQWLRQLRRLSNFAKLAQRVQFSAAQRTHCFGLWRKICHSPGFHKSFEHWWIQNAPAELPCLPREPPDAEVASLLADHFELHLRTYERALLQSRVKLAKQRRADDPHVIYQDIKGPPPSPVQMLVKRSQAKVIEVDTQNLAVGVDPPQQWDADQPVMLDGQTFEVVHAEPDKLWLTDLPPEPCPVQVSQEQELGDLPSVFAAFGAEWQQRWDKHADLAADHWDPVLTMIDNCLPPLPPMDLQPITPALWRSTLQRKKKRAAVGPDSVTREDLLRMDDCHVLQLLDILHQVELTGQWPMQMLDAFVIALEKQLGADQVNQFRPIVILPVCYRTWSSIRARQILEHLAPHAPATCLGNLPGRSANQVWHKLMVDIELGHAQGSDHSGGVIDLVKAYNLLPRIPVMQVMHRLGVHPQILRAWGGRLWDWHVDSRFVRAVARQFVPQLDSQKGAPSLWQLCLVWTFYAMPSLNASCQPARYGRMLTT